MPVCNAAYCNNNGLCTYCAGKPICACKDGWTGTYCENTISISYKQIIIIKKNKYINIKRLVYTIVLLE